MMALSFVRNEADAEDVAQEAFLKAFRNLASFRREAKFSTWLISISLNEARRRLRKKTNALTEALDYAPDGGYVSLTFLRDGRGTPSDNLERHELRKLLQKAIAELPATYREVLLLRERDDLKTSEVAEVLKISVASVKVRLHRARLMMQKTARATVGNDESKREVVPASIACRQTWRLISRLSGCNVDTVVRSGILKHSTLVENRECRLS